MPLRLAVWNCRMGVDRKRAGFARLEADVIVVPECAAGSAFSQEEGVSFAWRGRNTMKGLGVFAFRGRLSSATLCRGCCRFVFSPPLGWRSLCCSPSGLCGSQEAPPTKNR